MNKNGMTYLEVLIAMIIMALVSAGVYTTFSLTAQGPASSGAGSLDIQASSYARDTIERLKSSVSVAPGGTGAPLVAGPYIDDLPSGYLKDSCSGKRTYVVEDVKDPASGAVIYKKVTVTVKWNG